MTVIEALDVVEDRRLRCLSGGPPIAVEKLALKGSDVKVSDKALSS